MAKKEIKYEENEVNPETEFLNKVYPEELNQVLNIPVLNEMLESLKRIEKLLSFDMEAKKEVLKEVKEIKEEYNELE